MAAFDDPFHHRHLDTGGVRSAADRLVHGNSRLEPIGCLALAGSILHKTRLAQQLHARLQRMGGPGFNGSSSRHIPALGRIVDGAPLAGHNRRRLLQLCGVATQLGQNEKRPHLAMGPLLLIFVDQNDQSATRSFRPLAGLKAAYVVALI